MVDISSYELQPDGNANVPGPLALDPVHPLNQTFLHLEKVLCNLFLMATNVASEILDAAQLDQYRNLVESLSLDLRRLTLLKKQVWIKYRRLPHMVVNDSLVVDSSEQFFFRLEQIVLNPCFTHKVFIFSTPSTNGTPSNLLPSHLF